MSKQIEKEEDEFITVGKASKNTKSTKEAEPEKKAPSTLLDFMESVKAKSKPKKESRVLELDQVMNTLSLESASNANSRLATLSDFMDFVPKGPKTLGSEIEDQAKVEPENQDPKGKETTDSTSNIEKLTHELVRFKYENNRLVYEIEMEKKESSKLHQQFQDFKTQTAKKEAANDLKMAEMEERINVLEESLEAKKAIIEAMQEEDEEEYVVD